jgi:Cu(I)/Ag(I) efflux system membrane fusion protein
MDPSYRRDEPGQSPMGMDLVPVYEDELGPAGEVRIDGRIRQAMNIRTAEVRQGRLWRRIQTVGRVEEDPSRQRHIHPRVEGWIQALDVDAEGDRVAAGERLFTLYSPELVNAQKEFLQALRRGDGAMISGARDRLRAMDVQPAVLERLEREREVIRDLPWHAEADGWVTALGVRAGMFVAPGSEIMELTDLSRLWVIAEVFDGQSEWLSTGLPAEIGLPYAPGETVETEVSHIYPRVNPETRAVQVRLPVNNPANGSGLPALRPGMWNAVTIYAGPREDRIFIPREALIQTGRGNRVVVSQGEGVFRVRDVVPGMVSGDQVAIQEGLEPGETVVTSGQFLIDSEATLQGGSNRMEGGHAHH